MSTHLIFLLAIACMATLTTASKQDYIVYMGGTKGMLAVSLTSSHLDILTSATGSVELASEAIIHSYKHAFNGFSARLTEDQAKSISKSPGVIGVYPSRKLHLHTTRSWDFLGLTEPFTNMAAEEDVIVGVIDTGIWPESESFNDNDLSPVPSWWKGECVNADPSNTTEAVICNKKLIGARYYNGGVGDYKVVYNSARDEHGHGTHTSSTAGGRLVTNASRLGVANGTARGGVPGARVAMYKVCWVLGGSVTCTEADILAGIDDAVQDGVNVISISIGGRPITFNKDPIALGAYHAVERGISFVASAGNSGPAPQTVTNSAPWIFTIGASTIDRFINETQTVIPYNPAPLAAEFSSRGPNRITPDIIKPDVTAPGVQILAAYPSNIPLFRNGSGYTNFTIMSGTSMSCPHVAGTVAYVKSMHPTWSPAAIRSAIMTTATTTDNTNNTIKDEATSMRASSFVIGSGEIQPTKAVDPGLIYDIEPQEYITYLCAVGYTSGDIQNITGNPGMQCPDDTANVNLNYPSIGFSKPVGYNVSHTVVRTVTNVGDAQSSYSVSVETPTETEVYIEVSPEMLVFTGFGQKQSYTVTVTALGWNISGHWAFSSLTWSDGKHQVRSPIAVPL